MSGTRDGSGAGESANGAEPSLLQRATPNVIRRNFALKFGIVLVVLALSIGAIGIAATQEVKSQTQENVRSEYQNVAQQEADLIEQWVTRNRLSAALISNQNVWGEDEGLEVALRNEQAELPSEVTGLHIIEDTLSVTTIIASTTIESGYQVGTVNRLWIAEQNFTAMNEVYVSDVYEADGEPIIGFLTPVSAADDRYLLIEYELDGIASSLQGAERAEGGFTQVVDANGTVVIDEARTPNGGLGEKVGTSYSQGQADQPIEAANELREPAAEEAGIRESMPANDRVLDEEYTVGYSPVDGTDWVVLVHAPTSSVFGWVNQIEMGGFVATLAGVILIGGVGISLGYNTATSIDRLRRKADEMREGNLDVDIASARIDSIGQLYGGFADMRDSLKEQIETAERARKEAEVARAEAMETNNYLQEKASEFSTVMEEAAAGDMTSRMTADGENEAMDRIATEFNEMITELEKTTGQLKSFSEEVAESGDVVLQSAESVREVSERVAESTQTVSDDAYEQRERLRSISEDLEELVAALETLDSEPEVDVGDPVEECRAVASELRAAADTSEHMMSESETVAGAAEEQAAELNEVTSRADRLKRYARPLGDILDRFETQAEHEFVFSGGPSQSTREAEDD